MIPSNPTNSQPFIYRIFDSLGIAHLVAPVDHTHSQSEVSGLTSALAQKSDTNHTHAIIDAGEAIVKVEGSGDVTMTGERINFAIDNEETVTVDDSNIENLSRALQEPDSTPTTNSDKLVTSGGVKTALDAKQDVLTFDTKPKSNSTNPVTSKGIKAALDELPHWEVISNNVVLGNGGANCYGDNAFIGISTDMVYVGAQLRLVRVSGNTTYSGPYYGSVVQIGTGPLFIETTMSHFYNMGGTIYELAVLQ